MKTILCKPILSLTVAWNALALAMLWLPNQSSAQSDVTSPGDPIVLVNGTNDGDANAGAPPAAEGVEHVIDNVGQKYLNFLDLGSGFAVQPRVGATVVTGLRLYTANDSEARDPASYLLQGSTVGTNGPWTTISSNALALPSGRNPGGVVPLSSNYQTLFFANPTAYAAYRLTFPTLKDAASANSMQIGEVELLGSVLPKFAQLGRNRVGSATNNGGGSFTVVGGGNDIWDNLDECSYLYTELCGDF